MAGKSRKDSRGYALRTGECQRADGRYSYSYTDKRGDRHSVYAPSLVELRAKEKEIAKNRLDGLDPLAASRLTLNDMFDRYISQKFIIQCLNHALVTVSREGYLRPKEISPERR